MECPPRTIRGRRNTIILSPRSAQVLYTLRKSLRQQGLDSIAPRSSQPQPLPAATEERFPATMARSAAGNASKAGERRQRRVGGTPQRRVGVRAEGARGYAPKARGGSAPSAKNAPSAERSPATPGDRPTEERFSAKMGRRPAENASAAGERRQRRVGVRAEGARGQRPLCKKRPLCRKRPLCKKPQSRPSTRALRRRLRSSASRNRRCASSLSSRP